MNREYKSSFGICGVSMLKMNDLKRIQCFCAVSSQSNYPTNTIPPKRIDNPDRDTGTATFKKLLRGHSIYYASTTWW